MKQVNLYAIAEALEISCILDEHIHVKERERGYLESEHILALAAKNHQPMELTTLYTL